MEEYLKMLSEKLAKFDEETKNEILEDYKEHFREAHAAGTTDEQIIADLGDVDEMLSELGEIRPKAPISVPEVEENILHPEKVTTAPCADYNSIVVDGTVAGSITGYSANIQVYSSQDDKIHAEYTRENIPENSPTFGIVTEDKNGTFTVKFIIQGEPEGQPKGFLSKFFKINIGVKDTGTIKLFVPQNFPALTIKNSSGSTDVHGISVGSLVAACSSGCITADKIKANEVAITSSSGSNSLSYVSASKISALSSSGALSVDSCLADSFSARSSSGANIINNVTAAECTIVASSGAVNAENIISRDLCVTGSSGCSNISCRGKNINVSSGSGCANVHIDGHFNCLTVKSGSGSINLSGYDVAHSVHNIRHGSGAVSVQAGEGEKLNSVVNVSCGSGHISITE